MKNLIVLFFFASTSFLYGQESKQNSMSKIYQNPFTRGQNTWLNNKGFYIMNYDWSDPKINKNLDQAILNRSLGKVTLVSAIGTLAIGSILYFSNEMADDPAHKNDNYKAFFIASAGMVAVSVTFFINADSKVKKAKKLRDF